MVRSLVSMMTLALVAIGCARPAAAEATTLRAAKQYGLGYVQFMIMEEMKLVEKHAQARASPTSRSNGTHSALPTS